MKKAPFKIDRNLRVGLVEQIVDGLQRSIKTGVYKPGEIIPSTRELAAMLGVSRIVTRAAVRRLAEENLVNPCKGLGCVVLDRQDRLWLGNVLLVTRSVGTTYYVNVFTERLRELLADAGWILSQAVLNPGGHGLREASAMRVQLSRPTDMAIVLFDNDAAIKQLVKADIPYLLISSGENTLAHKNSIGEIRIVRSGACDELLSECVRLGVKTVLQVGFEKQESDLQLLRRSGISVKNEMVRITEKGARPEVAVLSARRHFEKQFSSGTFKLPELIYFSDDFACVGALQAFNRRGIRIPEEVRVVSWSNHGNGPFTAYDIDHFEIDPVADAERTAVCCLSLLKGEKDAVIPEIRTIYRKA